jgi:hypothetical protein
MTVQVVNFNPKPANYNDLAVYLDKAETIVSTISTLGTSSEGEDEFLIPHLDIIVLLETIKKLLIDAQDHLYMMQIK